MNIKKQFEEIFAILEANQNRKVSSIMPELMELMSRKSAGGADGRTFLLDENGQVYAIFCYYHKKWELIDECEFGLKKGTASGYNTMCKVGVNQWTKQQRDKKKANEELLTKVMAGELLPENIASEQAKIDEQTKVIIPREDGLGFDSVEELMN